MIAGHLRRGGRAVYDFTLLAGGSDAAAAGEGILQIKTKAI
jgi:hypothetical protein